MQRKRLYPAAKALQSFCGFLQVSPERILRRAGLPIDLIANEGKGIDAKSYFALWQAIFDEVDASDKIMDLAVRFARGPFMPPLFAFSCSPNIEEGINRLALFKPLLGPLALDIGGMKTRCNGLCVQWKKA